MAKDKFLAVAFTDVNGDNKYKEKDGDVVISAINDTDGSHDISVGDTVTFGTYPHLDGTEAGTFLGADTTITSVVQADSSLVVVGVADGFVRWEASGSTEAFATTVPVSGAFEASFGDEIIDTELKSDGAHTSNEDGPADPDTAVGESVVRVGDDGFLDVLIA